MKPHWIPAALRTGSEEQSVTRSIFEQAGGLVYSTSAPKATRSSPGIPDKLIVFPNRRILLAWDDKAGVDRYPPTDRRRLSEEQEKFARLMELGLRTEFGFGDAEAAKVYLSRTR